MSTFAENLKAAMEQKGITQQELCKRTGLSKPSICQYLAGSYKPRDDSLALLAQALGTTKGRLLGYESGKANEAVDTQNLMKVPVYSADEPDVAWGFEYITAEPGEYVFYICRNDKLRPFVMSGDYLLVSVNEISGSGLYALKREGGSGRIHFREMKNPRSESEGYVMIGRICEIRRKT